MAADTDIVFKAAKFQVESRRLAGRTRPLVVVVHPGAAVVLPLLNDEQVVLIENQRPAIGQALLEVPAGTLEAGEDPLECARRELAEETGYRAGRIESLLTFYSTPGFCTERMHVYLARDLTPGATAFDEGEQIRTRIVDYRDALRAVTDGRIVDGKTIAALLFYDRFRKRTS